MAFDLRMSGSVAKRWILRKIANRSPCNVLMHHTAHVGPFTRLWASEQLIIGQDVYIGKFCTVEVNGSIGAGTLIANSVGLVGRHDHAVGAVGVPASLGEWIGERVASAEDRMKIGRDCWIGYGAVVLSGVEIGDSSIIGSGSVVVRDVPRNSIAVGNPAKVVGTRFSVPAFGEHRRLLEHRYPSNGGA